jgi:hypothetical protein
MHDSYQPFYDAVAAELSDKILKPGLWARAIAEAGSEDDRAKAIYIRLRVAQLKEESEMRDAPTQVSPAQKEYSPRIGLLRVMLWTLTVLEAAKFVSSWMQWQLLQSAPYSLDAANANDSRQRALNILYWIAYLFTAISFCRWIIKAHRRVREFGAQGMTISPGWAVGYFFVPFLNLVLPYRAMKELWQASESASKWMKRPVPGLLPLWWALWITAGVLGQYSLRLSMQTTTIESLKSATIVGLFDAAIGLSLNLVALRLVTCIAQNLRKNEITASHQPPPTAEEMLEERRQSRLITLNCLLLGLTLTLLIFVVPVFAAMFADFGAKLPAPTQLAFDLSNFFKTCWWFLTPIGILGIWWGFGKLEHRFGRAASLRWLRFLTVIHVLLVLVIVLACFLPIFQLGAVAGGLQ